MTKKVMVIGLDAPITKSIEKYVKEGKLPNISKLIKNGTWAENCLVPHPTITPPNWTTIVTGSWPGTHGITCFHLHKPGMNLDENYEAFYSGDCQSEYIWQAAERDGKKSVIMNYPSTWPPTIKDGIQIGGAGLNINEWRIDRNNKPVNWYKTSVADDQIFCNEEYPDSDVLNFVPAKDWKNIVLKEKFLEAKIKVGYRNCLDKVKPQDWYVLLQNTNGNGYDTVSVAKTKDAKDVMFTLKKGEWSKKIEVEFVVNEKKEKTVFMAKLVELSPDGKNIKLYFTPFCQLSGWAYPQEITKELENIEGLPFRCGGIVLHWDWLDVETYLELVEIETRWLGAAASHILKNHEWDLFFMQAHTPDHSYHAFINKLEPQVCKDEKELKKYQNAELSFYESLDRMIGKIVECADEDTMVMIVSDHGATPTYGKYDDGFKGFNPNDILEKIGLLVYKEENDERKIDWSKTRAYAQRSVYVYVNLKGRDPQGTVSPGKEYEEVREKIIAALYNYTDDKTGKKPIVFALRKEDARILGLYGDRVGDIVYGITAESSGEHGRQLTTGDYGMGSIKGLLILCGPNVKKGHRLQRTVWLTDIVPTICYMMNIPVPVNAEGAVIYQAMEDPDFKIRETETLRKNYERVKRSLEANKALTHDYR